MKTLSLNAAATLAMMVATAGPEVQSAVVPKPEALPKNKYNLTEEDIEKMSSMTPKEKKIFLKDRRTR